MNQDESKDKKCSLAASRKLDAMASSGAASAASPEVVAKGETVAAAVWRLAGAL